MPKKFSDHAHDWSRLVSERRTSLLPADRVLDALDPQPGRAYVDVGAGIGYLTLPLAARVGPDGTVWAVDVAPEALRRLAEAAAAKGLTNVRVVQSEESRLPLPSAVADGALLVHVLHELSAPVELLKEVARVLAPGGTLLVVDWDREASDVGPPFEERVAAADAVALLAEAGLEAVRLDLPLPHQYALAARHRRP